MPKGDMRCVDSWAFHPWNCFRRLRMIVLRCFCYLQLDARQGATQLSLLSTYPSLSLSI